jgi:hypothetical protein
MKKLLLLALAMISAKAFCNDLQTAVELEMIQKLMNKNFYFIYYLSPLYITNDPTEDKTIAPVRTDKNRFANSNDLYFSDHARMYDDIQRCKRGEELEQKGTFGSCKAFALTLNAIKLDDPTQNAQKAAIVSAVWKNGK